MPDMDIQSGGPPLIQPPIISDEKPPGAPLTSAEKAAIQDMLETWQTTQTGSVEERLKFLKQNAGTIYDAMAALPELTPPEESALGDVASTIKVLSGLSAFNQTLGATGAMLEDLAKEMAPDTPAGPPVAHPETGSAKKGAQTNAFLAAGGMVSVLKAYQEFARQLSQASVQENIQSVKLYQAQQEQVAAEAKSKRDEGARKEKMYNDMANLQIAGAVMQGAMAMAPLGKMAANKAQKKEISAGVLDTSKQMQLFQGFAKEITDALKSKVQGAGEMDIANLEAQQTLARTRADNYKNLSQQLAGYSSSNHDLISKTLESGTQMNSEIRRAIHVGISV